MRDFLDVYMKERKRANAENDTESSFYGQTGHWNFVNSMFDLWLGGSETTSTSLMFSILYMVLNPRWQKRLQDELDEVELNCAFCQKLFSLNVIY